MRQTKLFGVQLHYCYEFSCSLCSATAELHKTSTDFQLLDVREFELAVGELNGAVSGLPAGWKNFRGKIYLCPECVVKLCQAIDKETP